MARLSNCDECTLNKGGGIVGPSGETNSPLIAFIGDAPTLVDVKKHTPFSGPAGEVIRRLVKSVGLPVERIYFTNTCLCRPPDNRAPVASEIACCFSRLEAELMQVNPKAIVTLGALPGRAVFHSFGSMSSRRGRLAGTKIISIEGPAFMGMPTYHPAACLFPGGDVILPHIASDLQKVKRFITGERLPYSERHTDVFIVRTDEDMHAALQELQDHATDLSYDWETTGLNPRIARGFCLGISYKVGHAITIPVGFVRLYKKELSELFERCNCIAFNAMFDSVFNEVEGLPGKIDDDPMSQHAILDERPQQRNLENLSVEFCDAPSYETEMLAKHNCTKATMIDTVPPEEVYTYCGMDTDYSLRLYHIFKEDLSQYPRQEKVYKQLLVPALRTFKDIQHNGVWVHRDRLDVAVTEYQGKTVDLTAEMKDYVGSDTFNPNSHPQVQKFLWDNLRLQQPNIYGRKNRSADKATQVALMEKYPNEPFVRMLHDYKEAHTLWSRYLRGLPDYVEEDGRVRCSWHFDRSETGRLSTTNPALHQIPRESGIRTIFGAPPGKVLLQADYSQIEIRMAAHIAQDKKLTELLKTGIDFHTMMASQAFGTPVERVTGDQRQAAKAVSFGLLYLMSDKKLASNTGLPPKDAIDFVKRYKASMPDVWRWIDWIKRQVKDPGYVESVFGRRRRFHLITNENLAGLQREAVNMPIQSSASDLTLWQATQLHKEFKNFNELWGVMIVLLVHDSINIEIPWEMTEEMTQFVGKRMIVPPFKTEVPFPVEIKCSPYWGEGEKVMIA